MMMTLIRPRWFLALLAAAGLPLTAALAPSALAAETRNTDFARVLPAGSTDAVFVVDDFFKYGRFDEKSPMARLLANPAVDSWITDLLPAQITDIKDDLDLSPKETARLFSGKGAIAFMLKQPDASKPALSIEASATDNKKGDEADGETDGEKGKTLSAQIMLNPEDGLPRYDKLVLVEFQGSPAEYEELAGKLEAETRRQAPSVDIKRERVEGVTLRTIDVARSDEHESAFSGATFLALYESTIILSTSRDVLLDAMHNLSRGGAADPLSGRPDYLADKKEMGTCDGFFFANLGTATPKLREFLLQALETQVQSNPMAKAMVDPKTMVDAIALGNFTSLYGSVTVSEKQVEARYGLTWKDQTGLASLIRFGSSPVTVPAYASGDYKGIDVTTADYRAIYEAADHLVQTALPTFYPMIGMGIANQPGVRDLLLAVRKGMLENLDGEMVSLAGFSAASPTEGELPGKAVVLGIKDPPAAQSAIDAMTHSALISRGAKIEPKDYLGVKLYKLPRPVGFSHKVVRAEQKPDGSKPANPDMSPDTQENYFFCAAVGSQLVISAGTEEFTKGVIANVQKPGRAGIADKFKDEAGDSPGTLCSLSYGDVATYLTAWLNAALEMNVVEPSVFNRDDLLEARSEARDLHYFWIGKSYSSPGGFFGRLTVSEDRTAH